MEATESAELLERARKGDMDAFLALFEESRSTIAAVAWRLVGPDESEDVVMETYLRAWKSLPGFSGRSGVRTWLCRIAHNCAVDWLRKRRHMVQPLAAGEDAAGEHGGEGPQVVDDGLSYSEIAAATGVSIGTVMSRLFNGRRKLVKALANLGVKTSGGWL